jgi:hypothetical protein
MAALGRSITKAQVFAASVRLQLKGYPQARKGAMYLRAMDGHTPSDCPMGAVARSGWRDMSSNRYLAAALNCALLSECPARVVCLERVSHRLERRQVN